MAVSPASTNVMLVWEDMSSSNMEIRARIFIAANGLYTSEFTVNALTNGLQLFPSVAGTTNGFAVAFQTQGFYTNAYGVAVRRFLADGTPVDAQEFRANVDTVHSALHPVVGVMTNGGLWVMYEKSNGSNQDIYTRSFTESAVPKETGDVSLISDTGDQGSPAIARLRDGRFVFAYENRETGRVDVQVMNPMVTGSVFTTGNILTNAWTYSAPDVAALSDGGFVMVCEAETNNTAAGRAVFAQLYTSGGVARAAMMLGSHTKRWERPSVAAMSNGGFVATWQTVGASGDASDELAVFSARFTANGIPGSWQHLVHEVNTNDQHSAKIVSWADGTHVIAWQSFGQDATNGYGIFSSRVAGPAAQAFGLSIDATGGTGRVSLVGIPHEIYTVETSTNLLGWNHLLTTNTPIGLATWLDLTQTNNLYFRAWSLP